VAGVGAAVHPGAGGRHLASRNSNKPPSSDPPFKKKPAKSGAAKPRKGGKKRGGQKGHKGHKQVMLDPTEVVDVSPTHCSCGCHRLSPLADGPFYVHQEIELPEIKMDVIHFRLFAATCQNCGQVVKGRTPDGHHTGYGPRLCALVAQLSGPCGESRETVRDFIRSVLGIPISIGAIQNIIDRASAAIEPIHEAIADEARQAPVNHVDETSWKTESRLKWLWVMANPKVAFFMIHKNRSYDAFCQLVDAWEGILVSDDYALYRKWVHERQSCLAHHLRRARGLAERKDPDLAHFGERLLVELSLLARWGHDPPTMGEWRAFIARFKPLLARHRDRKDEAGVFARRLVNEMEALWLCISETNVEPTNNHAERGAHQQPRRTSPSLRRHLAQTQPGHPKRKRRPLGGAHPVAEAHLPHAQPSHLPPPDPGHRRSPERPTHRPGMDRGAGVGTP